jgi:hypothetical protein
MLNLVVVEGEGAINNIRQRTAREPIVEVQDENHRPVAGAIVTFTLPSRGASGVFANGSNTLTVTTDAQGRAVARGLRPNNVSGQVQVRVNANFGGRTASTVINMTNAAAATAAGASAGGVSGKLIAVLVAVGAAAAGGIAYAATRNGGTTTTPTVPATPATTVAAGTSQVGPPR